MINTEFLYGSSRSPYKKPKSRLLRANSTPAQSPLTNNHFSCTAYIKIDVFSVVKKLFQLCNSVNALAPSGRLKEFLKKTQTKAERTWEKVCFSVFSLRIQENNHRKVIFCLYILDFFFFVFFLLPFLTIFLLAQPTSVFF